MVFVSYSRRDQEFVDRLLVALYERRVPLWYDNVEIAVGDRLQLLQEAIAGCDKFVAVLSNAYSESEWCQMELNRAIAKEQDGGGTFILPLLLEGEVPEQLRDHVYADFRASFEVGLAGLLGALQAYQGQDYARAENGEFLTDLAVDWGPSEETFHVSIDSVSINKHIAISVLCQMQGVGNAAVLERFNLYQQQGHGARFVEVLLAEIRYRVDHPDSYFLLDGKQKEKVTLEMIDPRTGMGTIWQVMARRMGQPTPHDTIFHYGTIFSMAHETMKLPEGALRNEDIDVLRALIAN